jgi:ABC-2 type transport system permease protein
VAVALLAIATLAFGVRPTSFPLLMVGILCLSAGIMGIMMLFSVLGTSEAAVSGASWAIVVIMAMLGGGMIPLFVMKGWMLTLSCISVFRWAILALESVIWRGFSPAEMALPCGILLAIGVVGFTIGASILR